MQRKGKSMANNSKQLKPMSCPVCDKFYFTKLSEDEISNGETPNQQQCDECGWFYDLEQSKNPDLENQTNKMSLNQYKAWYKEKLKENPKWEYYQDFIGDPEPHLCPVCGEHMFEDGLSYDICPVCGWQDDGYEVDPDDENGGPSERFLEHRKQFLEKRKINPKYNWWKEVRKRDKK